MRIFGLLLVALVSSGFVPLPIGKVANSSRTDACAADGKGGWLDLGSNDLKVLPAGEADYAGVTFVVPPAGDETAKNCLILGRKGPESVTLKLDAPVAGRRLYLLHAVAEAPAPEAHVPVGSVTLRYADGTVRRHALETGGDVSEWTSGRSFFNALRAWTEYNANTQVALFVSQFKQDDTKKLVEVTFAADGKCPWMILAASSGAKTKLKPLDGVVEVTGEFRSPPPPPADLGRFPGKRPKNVILIVGDGMGQGAARYASYFKYGREDGVYFQKLPVAGLCTTFSANAPVTDSAAAATAFATGTKTSNGVLSMRVDAKHDRAHAEPLESVATRARRKGLGVAIMTSDPLYGATAGAFFAHAVDRGDYGSICEQALGCGFEAVLGAAGGEQWFRPAGKGGCRKDGRDLVAEFGATGGVFVRSPADIAAAPKGSRIIGALKTLGGETAIAEAMKPVLDRLAERPAGFFMMAECGDTDHACHANDPAATVKTVSMVEFMAETAVDFARARGDTLVIVTADHDTGHPVVLKSPDANRQPVVHWPETAHTKFPVPVYSYGPGAELFEGVFDNTDIAKRIANLLNL